jgi:hypothetical protein
MLRREDLRAGMVIGFMYLLGVIWMALGMRELLQMECRLINDRKRNRAEDGADVFRTCTSRCNWV